MQWRVLGICALCMVIDGFDVQAMAYAAPALIKAWGTSRSVLGPVFAAALLGMFAGSLMLAGFADKIGRRPMLIAATSWIALCMALTPFANSICALIGISFCGRDWNGCDRSKCNGPRRRIQPDTHSREPDDGGIVGLHRRRCGRRRDCGAGDCTFRLGRCLLRGRVAHSAVVLSNAPDASRIAAVFTSTLPANPTNLHLLHEVAPGAAMPTLPLANNVLSGNILAMLLGEGRRILTPLLWAANFVNMLCANFLAAWIPVLMSGAGYSSSKRCWRRPRFGLEGR
jgi:AAHS family 4-hydroxybenzoate transporter-like MFS transporter